MRKILITGASGGLAQAMVTYLPDDYLILIGRDAQYLKELYDYHPQVEYHQLDIKDDLAVMECLDKIYQKHKKIDILVNNAGYAVYKDFETFTTREAREMFEVNTFATMTFCQQVGGRMKKVGSGHIVNIVSMSGHIASAKSSLYSASKFACIGYSNVLRLELADKGVYVTTVNPGPIATKFFDQADPDGSYLKSVERFLLQPDKVARKIVAIFGRKKRELNLPWSLKAAHKFYSLFPAIADVLARGVFNYK